MDLISRARTEFEENVTCPVCLETFDDNTKKPKYLSTCCHTVCRICVDRLCFSGTLKHLTCPICRRSTECPDGIDSLPTNHDKLYLLKLDRSRDKDDNDAMGWCFDCGKKQALTCLSKAHSVIKITSQLFDKKIPLDIKVLTSRISKQAELLIEHRKEIAKRLDQASSWLDFHKKIVDKLKYENEERINELCEAVQSTDDTISLQTLLMLSINNDHLRRPSTRKESLEDEATLRILHELRQVEQLANTFGVSRNNSLFCLPPFPNLRNVLNDASNSKSLVHQWPLLLFEALNTDSNAPISTPNLFSTKFNARTGVITPVVSNERACFNFQTRAIPTTVVSAASPAPVFWFEGLPCNRPAALGSVNKGLLAARRRRKYFNSPLPSGKKF